jgi:hypothetical protein
MGQKIDVSAVLAVASIAGAKVGHELRPGLQLSGIGKPHRGRTARRVRRGPGRTSRQSRSAQAQQNLSSIHDMSSIHVDLLGAGSRYYGRKARRLVEHLNRSGVRQRDGKLLNMRRNEW